METYNLYVAGFQYSYQNSDRASLMKLYDDYVEKSDVDYLIDDNIQHPQTIGDVFYLTVLDIVLSLTNKFPTCSKRINVPAIGKIMIERGFQSSRRGQSKVTCYAVSKSSRILQILDDNSQS